MIKDIKASCVSKNSRHLSSFETQMCVFLRGAGTFAAQPRLWHQSRVQSCSVFHAANVLNPLGLAHGICVGNVLF